MSKLSTSFSVALAAALRSAKMRPAELARRIGVDRASVAGWLSGAYRPREGTLKRINDVLGTDLRADAPLRVADVARAMGTSPTTLKRGMRSGELTVGPNAIGQCIKSPAGTYRYLFYVARVRELCGVD